MTFEVPARLVMIHEMETTIQEVLQQKQKLQYWDKAMFLTGAERCLWLRDRTIRNWRDNWTVCLREDGKLVLVYHRRKVVKSAHVKVTNPIRQRAFGISFGPFWKYLPTAVLGRAYYLMRVATGDPYSEYAYPIWAFAPPSSGRA